MTIRNVLAFVVTVFLLLPAGSLFAADKDQDQIQAQDKMIYGWQLMTVEERAQYRAKMQSLNTKEEREAFRMQHHKEMQVRAKEKGYTLPDQPMRSGGPGPGAGSGGGGGGAGKGK